MTGAAMAAAACAAASGIGVSVAIGTPGGGVTFGYIDGSGGFGSVTPGRVKNGTIRSIVQSSTGFTTQVVIDSGGPNSAFFLALLIQKTDGTWIRLETKDASYQSLTGAWQWAGVTGVWTSTSPSPRAVQFVL